MMNVTKGMGLLALALLLPLGGGCGDRGSEDPGTVNVVMPSEGGTTIVAPTTQAADTEPAPPGEAGHEQPAAAPAGTSKPSADTPRVVVSTSMGTIEIELNRKKAPVTVDNFLSYVKKGHYKETIFHRVIPGFMVQGGGFTAGMEEKPTGEGIKNEGKNGLKNKRGTIAMARTSDPDSASAQFFVNVADNTGLDYPEPDGVGYAVFGEVVKGMDVVDRIVAVPTSNAGGHQNVPVDPITIKSVTVK